MNPNSENEARVRPLRERLREQTARSIRAAAEQILAERGIREARMEEIAQRAGVSVGTVYNHFQDRDALVAELLEVRRKELAEKLDASLATSAKEDFAVQLRAFARTVFEHFETHRQFLSIMLEGDNARIGTPSQGMVEIRERVEALVARGVKQGALIAPRTELLPILLMSAFKGLLIHELRHPRRLALEGRVDALCEYFLHGAGVP